LCTLQKKGQRNRKKSQQIERNASACSLFNVSKESIRLIIIE
jgi:hypothetical protein